MTARSLEGIRVLVTRPEAQARLLGAQLRRLGAVPIVMPLSVVEAIAVPPGAWSQFGSADRVVFTSANGVDHGWTAAPDAVRAGLRAHRGIIAIGPATALAAADRGMTVHRTPSVAVAESLLELLVAERARRVLWIRGAEARDLLPTELRRCGIELDELVAYRTIPAIVAADALQRAMTADVVTLASPSAVRRFVALPAGPSGARLVCIGPITARAARAAGLRVDAVAEPHTADGLITALVAVRSTIVARPRLAATDA